MANYKYPNSRARKRAQEKSKNRYKKKNMTGFSFKLHNEHDKEVISRLRKQDNKSDYIRQLILKDIEDNK